jgi:hypothetical protein
MFWTRPSTDEATPTDPLGLDSMRDELADKLVPCLTGRTRSHEDFYWCLTFPRRVTSAWPGARAGTSIPRLGRFPNPPGQFGFFLQIHI